MFTLVAVGATPARVSRSDMGMPVKRMSFFTKGSKIVAVLVAMASSVFWSNASDRPSRRRRACRAARRARAAPCQCGGEHGHADHGVRRALHDTSRSTLEWQRLAWPLPV